MVNFYDAFNSIPEILNENQANTFLFYYIGDSNKYG